MTGSSDSNAACDATRLRAAYVRLYDVGLFSEGLRAAQAELREMIEQRHSTRDRLSAERDTAHREIVREKGQTRAQAGRLGQHTALYYRHRRARVSVRVR